MICKTCKFNNKGYCKIFKIRIKIMSSFKKICIKYKEKKENLIKTNIKKLSLKQEKKDAKKMGARLRPASGSFPTAKGDMTKGNYLIESKVTSKDRYTLKENTLKKIIQEALKEGKLPLIYLKINKTACYLVPEEDWNWRT